MRKVFIGLISFLFIVVMFYFIWILQPSAKPQANILTFNESGCLILSYHRIRPANPLIKGLDKVTTRFVPNSEITTYSVYVDEFQQHLQTIEENGATVITPDQLLKALHGEQPLPPKSVLITFDDTDISVYRYAFPILKEMRMPFTIFIISGEVGNPQFKGLRLADWPQIQEMYASGFVTIGSHTDRMHYLTKLQNPPFLNPQNLKQFEQDARQSLQTFQTQLGITPIYFAYPYGFGTAETDRVLRDLGYQLIFTLAPGIVQPADPPEFMKRVLTTRETWAAIEQWLQRPTDEEVL